MMFFREPGRILFVANFFLAILATYGLSDLLDNYSHNRVKLTRMINYLLSCLFLFLLLGRYLLFFDLHY